MSPYRISVALAASLVCTTAAAQSYPVKPIRMIVPTSGGAYDSIAQIGRAHV